MCKFTQLVLIGLLLFITMLPNSTVYTASPQALPLSTAFTYQGQIKYNGTPVNSQCNFQFMLFDAATGGLQLGSAQLVKTVNVTDGLFTVQLNGDGEFGANAFTGNARWLQISVQCANDPAPITLTRQPLTATPYALAALTANTATSATTAQSANTAISATTAQSANTATSATTAQSANYALQAATALTATTALNAHIAISATAATKADMAISALTAANALSATNASYAINALSSAALQGRVVSANAPSTGQVLKWNGKTWLPDDDLVSSSGITEIAAGSGLTGGGVNGKVTLSVNIPFILNGIATSGSGLIIANNTGSQGIGLYGIGASMGVKGISQANDISYGLYGESKSIMSNSAGVYGFAVNANGVAGKSTYGNGVTGQGTIGVVGLSANSAASGSLGTETRGIAIGVIGRASSFGVSAESYGGGVAMAAVATGSNNGTTLFLGCQDYYCPSNARVFRVDYNGTGYFNGGTESGGADVAEFIPSQETLEPGDVVEIEPEHADQFRLTTTANSPLVAGVISTEPGVTLGAQDAANASAHGPRLALVGRVPVKVSAENGPIHPGDLLVSATLPGHAMKASPNPAVGTVIGKALGTLDKGTGTLLMLAMLR